MTRQTLNQQVDRFISNQRFPWRIGLGALPQQPFQVAPLLALDTFERKDRGSSTNLFEAGETQVILELGMPCQYD